MTLSLQAVQEVVKRSSGEAWLFFLTVSHPSIAVPMRFVNGSHTPVTSNGLVYQPTRFEIRVGSQDVEGQNRIRLLIAAVDQTLLQALQSMDPSPTIDLFATLGSSPNTVQFQQNGMQIAFFDVIGNVAIEAELTGSQKLNEAYPGILMDRRNVPGIFTDAPS